MTRTVISGVAVACAMAVGLAAQSQSAQTDRGEKMGPKMPGTVTMSGCLERYSSGTTGSGVIGQAAANPATTHGAYKLSHVKLADVDGAVTPSEKNVADQKDRTGQEDVRIMTHDDAIDFAEHVGDRIEVQGGWSNSQELMGTGVNGTGQGGSGTGGVAVGSTRAQAGVNGRAISNPSNGELNRVLIVTAMKLVAGDCDQH